MVAVSRVSSLGEDKVGDGARFAPLLCSVMLLFTDVAVDPADTSCMVLAPWAERMLSSDDKEMREPPSLSDRGALEDTIPGPSSAIRVFSTPFSSRGADVAGTSAGSSSMDAMDKGRFVDEVRRRGGGGMDRLPCTAWWSCGITAATTDALRTSSKDLDGATADERSECGEGTGREAAEAAVAVPPFERAVAGRRDLLLGCCGSIPAVAPPPAGDRDMGSSLHSACVRNRRAREGRAPDAASATRGDSSSGSAIGSPEPCGTWAPALTAELGGLPRLLEGAPRP